VKHWYGKQDRRIDERRRDWPVGVCGEHCLIQDQTKEHRGTVCSKIAGVDTKLEKLRDATVPWKIFAFLFTFSVLVVGAGFGYFGELADKQEEGLTLVRASLGVLKENQSVMATEIKSNQASLINEIETLKHRQDVLRDVNMSERRGGGK
jgi:hypothetical protein